MKITKLSNQKKLEMLKKSAEFKEVVGYTDEKLELVKIIDCLKNKNAYRKLGAIVPRGILFCGKSGVGKTLMAESFIRKSGLKCVKYQYGSIRKAFETAANEGTAIVFIDDMDGNYKEIKDCIDEFKSVIAVATAENADNIPNILKSPERFGKIIHIDVPNFHDSRLILKRYLPKQISKALPHDETVHKMMYGLSAAEIKFIIKEAGLCAATENDKCLRAIHFIKAYLKIIKNIPETALIPADDDFIEALAYREAGHIAYAYNYYIPDCDHDRAVPAFAAIYKEAPYKFNSIIINTEDNLKEDILYYLSGAAAVHQQIDDSRYGFYQKIDYCCEETRSDMENAYRLAKDYEPPEDTYYSYIPYCITKEQKHPDSYYAMHDEDVKKIINEKYELAKSSLKRNFVKAIADKLIKDRIITSWEIRRIGKSVNGQFDPYDEDFFY